MQTRVTTSVNMLSHTTCVVNNAFRFLTQCCGETQHLFLVIAATRLRSDRDRGHASESASADLGIARRWREAAIHLHRESPGLQPQDRQTRARNPPLGRPHRVHRSEQNWDLPAGGNVNAMMDLLQFHHRSNETVANSRRHLGNSKQIHHVPIDM